MLYLGPPLRSRISSIKVHFLWSTWVLKYMIVDIYGRYEIFVVVVVGEVDFHIMDDGFE